MKIKEITVGGSRTINLGNYNSIKVEGSCTIELGDDEQSPDKVTQARIMATNEAHLQMKNAYAKFSPPKKDKLGSMME